MAQTALNGWLKADADTWTKFSEINCTFVVTKGDNVEILGTDGTTPTADDEGIPYAKGFGEDASTNQLERYVGAGTADGLWFISRGEVGALFVSREAVA